MTSDSRLNLYPDLLERLCSWDGHNISIDPILAVKMGERVRDKIGFILAERFEFETANEVDASFARLLKITLSRRTRCSTVRTCSETATWSSTMAERSRTATSNN
jgi:hypothetical protein